MHSPGGVADIIICGVLVYVWRAFRPKRMVVGEHKRGVL
jgi:hypothetical protein